MIIDLKKFAETLGELIIDNGKTAKILSEEIGINRSTVTRYLQGNKLPTVEIAVKLADYFNCSVDYLLGLTENNTAIKFKNCPPFCKQLDFLLDHFRTNKYRLQKETKLSESLIYSWQRGQFKPALDNIYRLAKHFDCSVDFILGREV